jgi:hypothetical protein
MTDDEQRDGGVLAGLPASRPQRRSRRRRDDGGAAAKAPAPVAPAAASSGATKRSAAAKPAASGRPATTTRAKATSSAKGTASAKRSPSSAAGAGRSDRRIAQPGQPAGTPPRSDRGEPPHRDQDGGGVVGTAVQAAGELANIGLTAGGQFVRGVLSRLPRP